MRVGTRRSPLAQAQADRVVAQVAGATKVLVDSDGDLDTASPLHRMDRPGAFTATLTQRVVDGALDAAVHSLKDLPLDAPPGAPVAAVLERADAADVLLVRVDAHDANTPLQVRAGGRVGAGAPRRQALLRDADGRLVPIDVRGNVQTRMGLLAAGVLDGLVMAAAALERIEVELPDGVRSIRLDPARWPPAPGQGAIAVQAADAAQQDVAPLEHPETRRAVETERAVLRSLGGGCGLPLGAHAHQGPSGWVLDAAFGHPHGLRRVHLEGPDPTELAAEASRRLAEPVPEPPEPPRGERLVLLSMAGDLHRYQEVLGPAGYDVRAWPLIETDDLDTPMPEGASRCDWIAATSPRAAGAARTAWDAAARGAGPRRVAAVGVATAAALRREGLPVHLVAPHGTGASLGDALAQWPRPVAGVLWPAAREPAGGLPEALSAHGIPVVHWPVYATRPAAPEPPAGRPEAVVLASPSAVAAFQSHPDPPRAARLIAYGPTTRDAAERAGLAAHTCPRRDPDALLQLLEDLQ